MLPRHPRVAVVGAVAAFALLAAPAGPAQAQDQTALDLLGTLAVAEEGGPAYDRDLFPHWVDADGDGCDTRQEVLVAESLVPPAVEAPCQVVEGLWHSPYDGAQWSDPADVDVDHLVPLADAWYSGAASWSTERRRAFANDLGLEQTLVAVTDEVNQSKGADDPSAWLPPDPAAVCGYVTDWVLVKYRWDLAVDAAERSAVVAVLEGCDLVPLPVPAKGEPAVTDPPDPVEPTPPAVRAQLRAGETLVTGGRLVSASGSHTAVVQGDGNVVVYNRAGRALWSSGTASATGAVLALQTDGNLVAYRGDGRALWSTGTAGRGGTLLVMQDDGNLVLYGARGAALWWTGPERVAPAPPAGPTGDRLAAPGVMTAGQRLVSGGYALVLQTDGNLVTYAGGRPVWQSRTAGHPGSRLALQGDGNLVLYSAAGRPVWQTATTGATRLVLQGDGNLVLYRASGSPAWWTGVDPALAPRPPAPPGPSGSTLPAGGVMTAGQRLVSGTYALVLQGDGNLVSYAGSRPFWQTRTAGNPGARLVLQPDGNLVLYTAAGRPVWQSATSSASRLVLQGDGNLVLYRATGSPVWWTGVDPALLPPPPPAPPTPPAPPAPPRYPGDAVNCDDFATWAQAQAWYRTYFPYYGDVANLDGNNDGIVCERLPGAP